MTDQSAIPPPIWDAIRHGEAVLFLGSGATLACRGPDGSRGLTGNELRDLLCDAFLGGAAKDRPLAYVGSLARNEASAKKVHDYIANLFCNLEPTDGHLHIPKFRWKAILTTNFDTVVEQAYSQCGRSSLQDPYVVVSPSDVRTQKDSEVEFIKLHGCITRPSHSGLQLILSTEEYANHQTTRGALFDRFRQLGHSYPIIFVGYSLDDYNISQILFNLGDSDVHRGMYLNVNPALEAHDERYWLQRRIAPIKLPFVEFMDFLDGSVDQNARVLSSALSADHQLATLIPSTDRPSKSLDAYLSRSLKYVPKHYTDTPCSPTDFYRGFSRCFSSLNENLDVIRGCDEDIRLSLGVDSYDQQGPYVALLHGHAGSGKSVSGLRALKGLSDELDKICFYLPGGAHLEVESVKELSRLLGERFILYIEDALSVEMELNALLSQCRAERLPISFLLTARTNEWNVFGNRLQKFVNSDYELRRLSDREMTDLIGNLRRHGVIGSAEAFSDSALKDQLVLSYDRQLLVALHEITNGDPFEKICIDEYYRIVPDEARAMYLDVCTLHRLNVGARCGLIARISGIHIEDFRDRFFKPLEHVVRIDTQERDGQDYSYKARHSIIAELVYEAIVRSEDERAAQLSRVIRSMNTTYRSDERALTQMLRGGAIAGLFPTRTKGLIIFDAALDAYVDHSFVFHQRALYELRHSNGVLDEAMKAITECERLASGKVSDAVIHTKALILRRYASVSREAATRTRYRNQAKALLRPLLFNNHSSHAYTAFLDIIADEMEELLELGGPEGGIEDRTISAKIGEAEEMLHDARTRFPGDDFISASEARIAGALLNAPKAIEALERALSANPANGMLAVRLARLRRDSGDLALARSTLIASLEKNPLEKRVNYHLARVLIDMDEREHHEDIVQYLRRSFTDGDANLSAQFWLARQHFLYGDRNRSNTLFRALRELDLSPEEKNRGRGVHCDSQRTAIMYQGTVRQRNDSYCFITCAMLGSDVFCYHDQIDEQDWDSITDGSRVTFNLDFSFSGPRAAKVKKIDLS